MARRQDKANKIGGRQTVVVHGRLAMRERRLDAARGSRHGLQIMTFEQVAARLAGGLLRPIDDDTLRSLIQAKLPEIELGELDGIKALPGTAGAATDTLRKAWRAGIDLQARSGEHPRLESIARIEQAVLTSMPSCMKRPCDIVAAALERIDHVGALFGPIEISGLTELSPCWRSLLHAIGARTPVCWNAGPRPVPAWLDTAIIDVIRVAPTAPKISTVSASTAYHEAIEAMRWARSLVAAGQAAPEEIGIASVSTSEYDDCFLALRADANFDLHFVHGTAILASREGQTAAALADILLRGLTQTRMRRLASSLAPYPGPFAKLPAGWLRVLPADAPLASLQSWSHLLDRLKSDDWPDDLDHSQSLREIVGTLTGGVAAAGAAGEMLLHGRVLGIWRQALVAGPAASIDLTLEAMKQDDGLEACVSAAWMPASALAASPRRFVRLLGLNSSRWPRGISEDRLLSDHIIPTAELDPLPVGTADRRDFATILTTTGDHVVLSRSRRDSDGRLLGRSTLLSDHSDEIYLQRNRVPDHAFSETDRLMARPAEFRGSPQASSAVSCWLNWQRAEVTAHDGLVRADHPAILAILARTQSASSLSRLLRNPLGFVWHYALRWRTPESSSDPLVLDALSMGSLVHLTLDETLRALEANGGIANASLQAISDAVDRALISVVALWETERAVPPLLLWKRTLLEARDLSIRSLTYGTQLPEARAYSEVPFGGSTPKADVKQPWDTETIVEIPDTGFKIKGYIDRLDISTNGRRAFVRDYKTGRMPKADIILNGGRELQRCFYAFAVKALLGRTVSIEASLLYPRDEDELLLANPEGALKDVAEYLRAARSSLLLGSCVLGVDTAGDYDDLAFALPANAAATYRPRKMEAATARLGAAAQVWEAP